MVHMIAQNDFADVVDRAAHGSQLNEHLGAVASVVDHALNGVQVSDHARQTVLYGFGIPVHMRVGMRMYGSVGMDVNVLLFAVRGSHMFHSLSLFLRHVLRRNAQHHPFRIAGVEPNLYQRIPAHRRELFDLSLAERLMRHTVARPKVRRLRRRQDGFRFFRSLMLRRGAAAGARGIARAEIPGAAARLIGRIPGGIAGRIRAPIAAFPGAEGAVVIPETGARFLFRQSLPVKKLCRDLFGEARREIRLRAAV